MDLACRGSRNDSHGLAVDIEKVSAAQQQEMRVASPTLRRGLLLCCSLLCRPQMCFELAYYRCYAPAPVSLAVLVRVAGRRWSVEETFQAGKGLAGLDQHQVRPWNSWHRWTTLAMLARAFLAVLATTERARQPPPDGMIPLTSSEIHHLLNVLPAQPDCSIPHRLRWSAWRRSHQHRARISHYQKRAEHEDHEVRLPY